MERNMARKKKAGPAPGPWTYQQSGSQCEQSHEWHVYADNALPGAKLPAICDTEENAKLVSAVHDLLDVAKAALYRCQEAKRVFVGRFIGDDELMEQLESAIRKATK
jgi:hypothetical protein